MRIGVARVNLIARLPEPLSVIPNNSEVFDAISQLAAQEKAHKIVVGLPRNLDGKETAQTSKIREFAKELKTRTKLEVLYADETLSTKRAQEFLKDQKSSRPGLDAVAACFILEEFIRENIS